MPGMARSRCCQRRRRSSSSPFADTRSLSLDDCLYALQATVPHLTRSALHRLFQRHGISRLPDTAATRVRGKFHPYPVGYIHIDLAELWTNEGKLYLFVAIDRVTKFAFAELRVEDIGMLGVIARQRPNPIGA